AVGTITSNDAPPIERTTPLIVRACANNPPPFVHAATQPVARPRTLSGKLSAQRHRQNRASAARQFQPQHQQQPHQGQDNHRRQRPFGAPPAVQQRGHEDCRKGDQRAFGQQTARNAYRIAFRHQIRRQPKQQAKIDQPPGQGTNAERGQFAVKLEADQRVRSARTIIHGDLRPPRLGAKPAHHRFGLFHAAARQQEFGGFRDKRPQKDQRQPRRQIGQPQDAPAKNRLQQGRHAAGREIAADRAQPADQNQTPAAMAVGHHFGQQRIGHRQHAPRCGAHHETHGDVPGQTGHRAAN
ncbi:hypothetical protein E4T56_gene15858, partial [Termitomyces sp. T112]